MPARIAAFCWRHARWLPPLVVGSAVTLVMTMPSLLEPVGRVYAALCERYPILALVTNHTPALPVALLLSLAGLSLVVGGWVGLTSLFATIRCTRRLRRVAIPAPLRLARLASDLGLAAQVNYLAVAEPMACCYGFLRPRIVVTAGLVERLDDAELTAVLVHERHHLRRCDPLRVLFLEALTAAAFMVPVATVLRQRVEARMELAADQAALRVVPRGALAGALLTALAGAPTRLPGVAGLTATEVRIAQLAGRSAIPPMPPGVVAASLGIVALILVATIDLARAGEAIRMMCPFCPWFH